MAGRSHHDRLLKCRASARLFQPVGARLASFGADPADRIITHLFKLYPWEWMLADEFGPKLPANKGLLAVLWEMFPNHPSLLPTYFEKDPRAGGLSSGCVRKPLLGREGANIEIKGVRADRRDGPYRAEGYVVQALRPLPDFAGNRPVIGSWVVAGQACGMGIRDEKALITSNAARFVPHVILN